MVLKSYTLFPTYSNAYCRSYINGAFSIMLFDNNQQLSLERSGIKIEQQWYSPTQPFGIDKIAARVQLRLLQSKIAVETKTQDNVFVTMNAATQY